MASCQLFKSPQAVVLLNLLEAGASIEHQWTASRDFEVLVADGVVRIETPGHTDVLGPDIGLTQVLAGETSRLVATQGPAFVLYLFPLDAALLRELFGARVGPTLAEDRFAGDFFRHLDPGAGDLVLDATSLVNLGTDVLRVAGAVGGW